MVPEINLCRTQEVFVEKLAARRGLPKTRPGYLFCNFSRTSLQQRPHDSIDSQDRT